MLLLCAHDMFYGWPYINGPSCGIPSSFQVLVLYVTYEFTSRFPMPSIKEQLVIEPGNGGFYSGALSHCKLE
jgi:hypothetical protein